jgi:uncharacterized membrane protein YozB (DUF420 family)
VLAELMIPVWILYSTLNPHTGRLSPKQHPMYFPVLMLHVLGVSLVMITCVIQVWPGLRKRWPRVHRYSGRVYVIGVMLAAIAGLILVVFWPFSVNTTFVQVGLAIPWIGITGYGWILARQRRFADHRRWMLRSFAISISFPLSETFMPLVQMALGTQLHSRLAGSQNILTQMSIAADSWLGFLIAYLAVDWWLDRDLRRRSARRNRPAVPPPVVTEDPVTTTQVPS